MYTIQDFYELAIFLLFRMNMANRPKKKQPDFEAVVVSSNKQASRNPQLNANSVLFYHPTASSSSSSSSSSTASSSRKEEIARENNSNNVVVSSNKQGARNSQLNTNSVLFYHPTSVTSATRKKNPLENVQSTLAASQLSIDGVNEQFSTLRVKDVRLPAEIIYLGALSANNHYFILENGSAIALADWDEIKATTRPNVYRIVTPKFFVNESGARLQLLLCTCEENVQQRDRLISMDSTSPILHRNWLREKEKYCIHCTVGEKLLVEFLELSQDDQISISPLTTKSPLLWVVRTERRGYGVIKMSKRGGLSCIVCGKLR